MNEKCHQCRTLSFREPEHEIPSLRGVSTLFHILHRTKESWLQSISSGCHLCTLVRGQVYNSDVSSPICDALGAFVVLAITVRRGGDLANDPHLTVKIISKLGNSGLKRIENVGGERATDPNFTLMKHLVDNTKINTRRHWTATSSLFAADLGPKPH